jgi:hypothetical protein
MFPGFLFGPAKWAKDPLRRKVCFWMVLFVLPELVRRPVFPVIGCDLVQQCPTRPGAGRIAVVSFRDRLSAHQAAGFLSRNVVFDPVCIS